MTTLGQLCLLVAMVASGYAAFACIAGWWCDHRAIRRSGLVAAVASVLALTSATTLLAWALLARDFGFAYVAQYCDRLLPWHYALSAFWVGQAGSLLCWAWLLAVLALAYRFWPGHETRLPARQSEADAFVGATVVLSPRGGSATATPATRHLELGGPVPREPVLGVLMAYLCFLVAVMVFGADPMEPSLAAPRDGAGLGPLLQHPAMLLHPPVVFLGYACWAIPFALALTALVTGRLDAAWVRQARPWAFLAWAVSSVGILVGAYWAYEELGWGGYWGWDPVENGSLLPWLTGTAYIHAALAWQHHRAMKKSAVLLAVATFGLCNFAAFLTRSGIFGSLHAFSQSPIGWMFLLLMASLTAGAVILVIFRRKHLASEKPFAGILTREALVAISTIALLLLTAAVLLGTLAAPLSDIVFGRTVVVGAAFYSNVLIPIGLLLVSATAMAPLVRWGASPTPAQRNALVVSTFAAGSAAILAYALGIRHPLELAVAGLAALAVTALLGSLLLDARALRKATVPFSLRENRDSRRVGQGRADAGGTSQTGQSQIGALSVAIVKAATEVPPTSRFAHPTLQVGEKCALTHRRRTYSAYLMHLSLVCLALGVTGSALGTRRHEAIMSEGETIEWAGHSIRYAGLVRRDLPGKFLVEAKLEITPTGAVPYTLLPAQHLHLLQNEWTSEVAIHSTWTGDFYTILHSGRSQDRVSLTFVENPMMRWLWLAGWMTGIGALTGLWPARRRAAQRAADAASHESAGALRRHASAAALWIVALLVP